MTNQLNVIQLQAKLATATGLRRTVISNQIHRLISRLQALLPTPTTRPPITLKRLTTLQQIKLSEFKYSTPQRGYLLFNPVKDTYIKNSKLNRASVKKQIDAHNVQLYNKYYLKQIQTNVPSVG